MNEKRRILLMVFSCLNITLTMSEMSPMSAIKCKRFPIMNPTLMLDIISTFFPPISGNYLTRDTNKWQPINLDVVKRVRYDTAPGWKSNPQQGPETGNENCTKHIRPGVCRLPKKDLPRWVKNYKSLYWLWSQLSRQMSPNPISLIGFWIQCTRFWSG